MNEHYGFVLPKSLAAVLLLASLASAQRARSYHYEYSGAPIPLAVDPSRLAVRRAPGLDDAGLRVALGPGLRADRAAIPGWADVRVERGRPASMEGLVAEVARRDGVVFASPVFLDPAGQPLYLTGEIFVRFRADAPEDSVRRALAGDRVVQRDPFGLSGVLRLRTGSRDGFEVLGRANELAGLPEVVYAEPDRVVTLERDLFPNDPRFADQWGLHNTGQSGGTVDVDVDAPEAWDVTIGDPSVLVAVLDDGVQLSHPDLSLVSGVTFTGTSLDGVPGNACDNHGTIVMGPATQRIDNGLGGAGIAPGCRGISLKWTIANVPCDGTVTAQLSWLADALAYCASNGIRVTVLAYGLAPSSLITDSYDTTHASGVVHFATTGNQAPAPYHYPATLDSVNAVGAADRNGARASFSQFGDGMAFCGPGVTVFSADRTGPDGVVAGDGYFASGTSVATPGAAAVAALVLSANPALSADAVEEILRASCLDLAAPGYDAETGFGLVNARAALAAAVPVVPALSRATGGVLIGLLALFGATRLVRRSRVRGREARG